MAWGLDTNESFLEPWGKRRRKLGKSGDEMDCSMEKGTELALRRDS